jgi:hypothetical protein
VGEGGCAVLVQLGVRAEERVRGCAECAGGGGGGERGGECGEEVEAGYGGGEIEGGGGGSLGNHQVEVLGGRVKVKNAALRRGSGEGGGGAVE